MEGEPYFVAGLKFPSPAGPWQPAYGDAADSYGDIWTIQFNDVIELYASQGAIWQVRHTDDCKTMLVVGPEASAYWALIGRLRAEWETTASRRG
jgi:hypothetical protein